MAYSSRRAKKSDPKQRIRESTDKSDNKTAMQAMIGMGIALVLIFGMIMASRGGKDPLGDAKKNRKKEDALTSGIPDMRQPGSGATSSVPYWLATQFMLALANEDPKSMGDLIAWDILFEKLDRANNIDEGKRYAALDEDGKMMRRDAYLAKVIDPDYVTLIRDNMLPELLAGGEGLFKTADIERLYGNVNMAVKDRSTDKTRLEILIKTELMPGKDPEADKETKGAWRIVGLLHEQFGVVRDGKRISSKRSDFGEGIGKTPKEKKPKGPVGLPESDPRIVEWPATTAADVRAKVEGLVQKVMNLDNPREGDIARIELIEMEKLAIPGILNGLAGLDHGENDKDIERGWQLIQALREITFQKFGYGPAKTALGFGQGGMTRATPEERVRAVRRWFGWWDKKGATFDRATAEKEQLEAESNPDDGEDEPDPGSTKK